MRGSASEVVSIAASSMSVLESASSVSGRHYPSVIRMLLSALNISSSRADDFGTARNNVDVCLKDACDGGNPGLNPCVDLDRAAPSV